MEKYLIRAMVGHEIYFVVQGENEHDAQGKIEQAWLRGDVADGKDVKRISQVNIEDNYVVCGWVE